jgi:hypothetical protein
MEQFMGSGSVSFAWNVKVTDDELVDEPLAGLMRATDGAAVSTMKFQVLLTPVNPAPSVHSTRHVWLPSAMELAVKFVFVPLRTELLTWLIIPSMKSEQNAFV